MGVANKVTMPRKRKGGGKKIAIGAMVVQVNESIDGSGDNYEVLTGDQVRALLAARSAT